MTKNDGGPAFTQLTEIGDIAYTQGGMSLRDLFAGQATETDIDIHREWANGQYACTREQARYRYAAAMIAARND